MSQSLPTGIVTILLTDIEGSTKSWLKHPSDMGRLLAKHDDLLIGAVVAHGGADLGKRGEGDSRFAVFKSPLDAAQAAVAIQRAVRAEEWSPLAELRVRIAIHTGEVELRNEDYFGPPVNRCARMRGAAHGGQIILSEATMRLIDKSLPPDMRLKDLGMHRFKDLLEPERIFELDAEGIEEEFPPLASLSAARHNLPIQLSSFVGRQEQLSELKKLVFERRLVTLLGAGGSGKTRLALQLGAETLEDFPDGVWFVSLVDLQDPGAIVQYLADALPISTRKTEPFQAIVDNYKEARALLIVDNCEHLARPAAALLNRLLRECGRIAVLATSREPVGIAGEVMYQVPTMQCDLGSQEAVPDNVGKLEAVQLLRDRASSRLSSKELLTAENAADIAALCKKLDGIPLALEQAAANLGSMSAHDILDRLSRHLAMPAVEDEGVDERHRTMQRTIDWSYGMLNEDERRLFDRLSIFSGGWTRAAAEHICGTDDSLDVVMVMQALVKRSMVVYSPKDERYRMLEPIREYANAKRPKELDEVLRARHFDWYAHLGLQGYEAFGSEQAQLYVQILEADHDNLRSALSWGLTHSDLANRVAQLCIHLHRFWLVSGHIREAAEWVRRSLDASASLAEDLRGELLHVLAILMWQRSDFESARAVANSSLAIFEALGDEATLARVRTTLGALAFEENDFATAVQAYESAVAEFRKRGDHVRLGHSLENLGVSLQKLGRTDEATKVLEEALQVHRQFNHDAALPKAIDGLLGVYADQGKLLAHLDLLREAIDICLQTIDHFTTSNLLEIGIDVCIELKDFPLATQAEGAMEVAIEQSERHVAAIQQEGRAKKSETLRAALGYQKYNRHLREGRTLGPATMLGFILQKIDSDT